MASYVWLLRPSFCRAGSTSSLFHWLDAFILYADNLSSSLPAGLLTCLIIAKVIDVDNYFFLTDMGYGVGGTYPMSNTSSPNVEESSRETTCPLRDSKKSCNSGESGQRKSKLMVCSFRYENSRVVLHPTSRLSDGWPTRRPAWTFRRHVRRPRCSATLSGRYPRIATSLRSTGSHCSPCRPRASCCFRRRTW